MTSATNISSRTGAARLVAVVAVGALLLAACGGDEPEADQTPADAESPAVETDTGTPQEDAATDEEAADEAAFTGPQQPARITYAFEQGDIPEGMDQFVLSFDPPRSALIYEQGRFIDTGEGETIICTTEGGEAQCFSMAGGENQFATGFFGSFFGVIEGVGDAVDTPGFNRTGTREVAGRQAACATFDPAAVSAELGMEGADDVEDAEVCVDEETGIGLWYSVTQDGETSTVTAVEFGDPQPDDFTPPAEPEEMPGQGG